MISLDDRYRFLNRQFSHKNNIDIRYNLQNSPIKRQKPSLGYFRSRLSRPELKLVLEGGGGGGCDVTALESGGFTLRGVHQDVVNVDNFDPNEDNYYNNFPCPERDNKEPASFATLVSKRFNFRLCVSSRERKNENLIDQQFKAVQLSETLRHECI